MAPRLILTGFMGTGKSTVAAVLARRLGWRLIDCDGALVARAGKSISAIFQSEGEGAFRKLERELIAEVSKPWPRCPQCGNPRPAVVATGGGALADGANFRALSHAGVIVCLNARPEIIAGRVEKSKIKRPKLSEGGKPLGDRIAELLAQRTQAYARAEITVDTSDLTVEEAADKVLAAFIANGRQPIVRD